MGEGPADVDLLSRVSTLRAALDLNITHIVKNVKGRLEQSRDFLNTRRTDAKHYSTNREPWGLRTLALGTSKPTKSSDGRRDPRQPLPSPSRPWRRHRCLVLLSTARQGWGLRALDCKQTRHLVGRSVEYHGPHLPHSINLDNPTKANSSILPPETFIVDGSDCQTMMR
jgi:hypothetical protein